MVTRVIAIPDSNGLIRVSCGGDTIEIQIAATGATSAVATSTAPPADGGSAPWNPFSSPFAGVARDTRTNPFDLPYAYISAPRMTGGKIDLDQLVKDVELQFADPSKPDPRAIVLSASEANLHELHHLGEQISKTTLKLPFAVNFGEPLKQ